MRTHASTRRALRAALPPSPLLQSLEKRQLLANIINVASYGAVPNDGINDTNAVQAAINASQTGDTILFDGGVFNLTTVGADGLVIPSDRTLRGSNGGTIKGHGSNGQLVSTHSSNIRFIGLTFDGGGIFLDKSGGGFNQNITVDFCVFNVNTSGANRNGITFTSGLQSSTITNNYFTGYNSSFGIYGYNYNTVTIANNEFVNISAGMHIDAFGSSGNLLVEQNYIVGAKGMGMEFQGTATHLIFQDNWYEHPNLSTDFNTNNNAFAYSLILDKSSDILIQRNVVIAPERPDGTGCRIGFEVGGDATIVQDNYINGVNHVLAVNDGSETCSVLVQNNQWSNYLQNASISFPSSDPLRKWTNINNGSNVTLTSVMTNRIANNLKPGIGTKRYDGSGEAPPDDPPPPPPPPPPPDPTAPNAATNLSAVLVNSTRIDLAWSDNSSDETGFNVMILAADGTTWITVATVARDVTNYSMTGVATGTGYSFQVVAFNDAGYAAASNIKSVTTPVPELSAISTASRRARTAFVYQGSISTVATPPLLPSA